MKGVITKTTGNKSIVLFNNGKIGTIPTPSHGKIGTIVTISYNKHFTYIILLVFILTCTIGWFSYKTPQGYLYTRTANYQLEMAYNIFNRIIYLRPLTPNTAQFLSENSLQNLKISEFYKHFANSPRIQISIACNNLKKANDLKIQLLNLLPNANVDIFTIELYQQKAISTNRHGHRRMRHN